MTPTQLNDALLARIAAVCRDLLPQGQAVGGEWQCGDATGAAGHSLRVHLSGEKAGVWADFATGETGGDLIDLWRTVHQLTLPAALTEIKAWLGVKAEGFASRPRRTYRVPERPRGFRPIAQAAAALTYLTTRRLTLATLEAFKLAASDQEIVFPYLRDGALLNLKYLKLDRPGGKKSCRQEQEAEPCLFGWQALPDAAREVVICEDELDACTVHQWGMAALSMPGGATGGHGLDWIEAEFEPLQRFDTLYLCTDMDEAGRKVLPEMVRRLGAERCRIVELPVKDPNEGLMQGLTAEWFHAQLRRARSQDPDELKPADAFTEEVQRAFYPDPNAPTGLSTPFPTVNAAGFCFNPGEVTVWSGWSGGGKSLMLGYFVLNGLEQGVRWCVASLEMAPIRTLTRMVRQRSGQKRPEPAQVDAHLAWMADKLWLFDLVGVAKLARLLEVFRYAARRYGITHFVVDSLAKFDLKEDDYSGQKDLVNALAAFAHEHHAHLHLVAHPRKALNEEQPPGKLDVRGGAALTDLVDNVVCVFRNRKSGDANGAFIIQKRRDDDGAEGWTNLWFDPDTLRYTDRRPPCPAA